MKRASGSRTLTAEDPGFEDIVRQLLEEEVDDPDEPDDVMNESDADSGDSRPEDEAILEDGDDNVVMVNAVAEGVPMPTHFLERMRTKEQGPPNAWSSKPPPRNVRTPGRNIIRGLLRGIKGPARALGNESTKADAWKLFFDDQIISKIVTNTNVKLASIREKIPPGQSKSIIG